MFELQVDGVTVEVEPEDGGRIGRIVIDDVDLLVRGSRHDPPMTWGSYPMVPWAGRVREGRFTHDGVTHQLPLDAPPHAIHGTGYVRPWERIGNASLRVDLGPDWPLGGHAVQHFALTPRSLTCVLEVHADTVAMPATIGWHPWFVKPDHVEFTAGRMYHRGADYLPDGTFVAPPSGPWDDCFTDVRQPIEMSWGSVRLRLTSSCDHWVVYDQPDHADLRRTPIRPAGRSQHRARPRGPRPTPRPLLHPHLVTPKPDSVADLTAGAVQSAREPWFATRMGPLCVDWCSGSAGEGHGRTARSSGEIGPGLCVLVGVTHDDDAAQARKLAEKLWHLRVMDDDDGVMNRSVADTDPCGARRQPVHALRRHRRRPAAELDRRRPARARRAARRPPSSTSCGGSAPRSRRAGSAPRWRSSSSTTARSRVLRRASRPADASRLRATMRQGQHA